MGKSGWPAIITEQERIQYIHPIHTKKKHSALQFSPYRLWEHVSCNRMWQINQKRSGNCCHVQNQYLATCSGCALRPTFLCPSSLFLGKRISQKLTLLSHTGQICCKFCEISVGIIFQWPNLTLPAQTSLLMNEFSRFKAHKLMTQVFNSTHSLHNIRKAQVIKWDAREQLHKSYAEHQGLLRPLEWTCGVMELWSFGMSSIYGPELIIQHQPELTNAGPIKYSQQCSNV